MWNLFASISETSVVQLTSTRCRHRKIRSLLTTNRCENLKIFDNISPWRWRQQRPPKRWYPNTKLRDVTTLKIATWMLWQMKHNRKRQLNGSSQYPIRGILYRWSVGECMKFLLRNADFKIFKFDISEAVGTWSLPLAFQSSAEVKNAWSYTSTPPTRLHCALLN
jgi:hypothetical protein